MTLEYIKPTLPDYLVQAMRHAAETLEQGKHISKAIQDAEDRQVSIVGEIQTQEDALGDLEAESLLRGKPDSARIGKAQERLDALRAEQRKLQAAERSLRQKYAEQDQAIVDACSGLLSARRDFGKEMLDILDAELRRHCSPIQHILHVARALYVVWDHSPLRNRYEDVNIRTFTDGASLIGHSSYPNYGSPEPARGSELAAAWQEALTPVRAMMDRVISSAEIIQERQRRQKEQEALEREREERLKPRYV
jgi:Skp family chaperone for outer membrane proteins